MGEIWVIYHGREGFSDGTMNFHATVKFISKFGYFKIFFAFLVKYPHTNDDDISNQDILSSLGGYVFDENTTYWTCFVR
jgi:hypothetical protein